LINVLLLHAESEAKLTNQHVKDELVRISERLGRDFEQFLYEDPTKKHPKTGEPFLYFRASPGTLHWENWPRIPRYGTEGDIADSAAGFALFFLTTTGMPFAAHHIKWADFVWDCFEDRVGAIIEAFRGSGKSIFMRILMAYLIGIRPELSSLIIRSAATPAQKTAEGIAKIIANHHGWHLWFPTVVPKSKPGQAGGEWSAQSGYSVRDTSIEEDIWNVMEAARTSPTLTKFGLGSKSVLGSRVTLAMLADDLHDEENSASPEQLKNMIARFQEIVENSRTPASRLAIIGTPWGRHDLLQQLPTTGEYRKIKTPITIEGTYPGTPRWPEHYDKEAIDKLYNKDLSPGKLGFRRNQLLDLEADVERHFTYSRFPKGKVENHWAVRMGVDYAALEAGASGADRSYFALTVTTQDPETGAWIVIDGFVGQVTQSQADRLTVDMYNKYGRKPRVEVIVVETAGVGREYEQRLARMPIGFPLIGESGGGVAKEVRWEGTLEPALAGERILISDVKNHPFIDELIIALNLYPNIPKRGDRAADILDSMVWAHFHAFMEYGDPVRRVKKKKDTGPKWWQSLASM
jgi:hypothetical protein